MELNTYPLVCTRGVILYPNQEIVIDVGRDTSVHAVENAQDNYDKKICLFSQIELEEENPEAKDIYSVGTLCEVRHIRRFDNFLRVKFRGIKRVKLNKWINGSLSELAEVEILESEKQDAVEEEALVRMIGDELDRLQGQERFVTKEIIMEISKGMGGEFLSDKAVQGLPLDTARKQQYLETLGINDRLMMLLQDMAKEKKMNEVEKQINETVKERIDQGQKDYYLREKMNVIREELGDTVAQDEDAAKIRKRLAENPYPDYIKKKVSDEVSRYEMLPMASGETGVIKAYIDWLMDLPWWQQTKDNEDLSAAEATLNADHYGLEKVKERILEYLAVKQMTNSLNAPIICLVGPPGVGKTSLAKSVARALDRKFVKMSLGGVRDEAEIRGHRKTYIGAMPGRIIEGLKNAGVNNPLMLLDEIDKISSDYKGDTSAALLEVLDSEQNVNFVDHYIEMPVDLSNVLFIATANDLSNISRPLLDRMEIIEVGSYTANEKFHIAKEHLIKKQIKENGLLVSDVKFTDKVIRTVINSYTREAGVRGLERQIAKIVRKAVRELYKAGVFTSDGTRDKTVKKTVNISDKNITDYLGKVKYRPDKKNAKGEVGIVRGLAWTQAGGDTLEIEVITMPGKGEFKLTGNMGDVMKESASIAVSYIRSVTEKGRYKVDAEYFQNHAFHLHIPEGATPKDGPSAGITMATAVLSAVTGIPVRADVAMTGELTLRGKVLPIGGLKEKLLASKTAGITNVFVPRDNRSDVEELDTEITEGMNIIYVNNAIEVFAQALMR